VHRGFGLWPLRPRRAPTADRIHAGQRSRPIQRCFVPNLCTAKLPVRQLQSSRRDLKLGVRFGKCNFVGRASIVKRTSPFRTMSPSLKNIPVSVPPTCARSSTCETAANWPRKPSAYRCLDQRLAHHDLWKCGRRSTGGAPTRLGRILEPCTHNTIPASPRPPKAWLTLVH